MARRGQQLLLETRRQIEAKNPSLIKDVFQPTRVLDLGCGPGALMHLLRELGVDVDGIDFNESSMTARDAARSGTASPSATSTDASLKPDDAYDLVICREVLEHLTVLEVRKAVANMVAHDLAVHLRHDALSPEPAVAARLHDAVRRRIPRTSRCSTRTCCG